MSDYILHNRVLFKGSTVLELGAGIGVVSIVACLIGAKCVLCTGLCKHTCTHTHQYMYTHNCYIHTHIHTLTQDVGSQVLDVCQRNVHRNLQGLELAGEISVKELDWRKPFDPDSNS